VDRVTQVEEVIDGAGLARDEVDAVARPLYAVIFSAS
jgi:hypothetical protein